MAGRKRKRGAGAMGLADVKSIGNKAKRAEVFAKLKRAKLKAKQERRDGRKRLRKELGDAAPPKLVSRTLENTREFDETIVDAG